MDAAMIMANQCAARYGRSVNAPFIIFSLPRSKTAWLAQFLTYGAWTCHHQTAIKMRTLADVGTFFAQHNVGTAETGASLGWRLLEHHVPNLRRVVVRRPIDESVAAMLRVDLKGVAVYDEMLMRRVMVREARALDDISARPGVLTVDFADLDRRDACAAVFEHCLPYPFPQAWWDNLRHRNVQADVPAMLRYFHANRAAIENFKRDCKSELRCLARAGSFDRMARAA
jgi:hypothetical protein